MKELRVLSDDGTGLYIAWEKSNVANGYVVLGKDNTFNDKIIKYTNKNNAFLSNDELHGIVAVTVEYVVTDFETDKEVTIDRTNSYIRKVGSYKLINIRAIKSIGGITLSYASSTIYDRYYIYEKINNKYVKILETEDFQINSKELKEGSTYYIEAYSKNDAGALELKSKSNDYVLEILDLKKDVSNPKVSVIIPAYNCQHLIPRAIDSLIFSTLNDMEIVIVDDGSKDKTRTVLEWYKNTYPNLIHVEYKENEGQALTRFYGLKFAKAPYTFYMDDDDLVHPNMLENMYNCIVKQNADFVMNKIITRNDFEDVGIFFGHIDDKNNQDRCIVKPYEEFILNKHNGSSENFYLVTLWHQLVKTDLYRAHPMPAFKTYEDIGYVRLLLSYGNRIAFQMDSYYVWDKRIGKYFGSSSVFNEATISVEEKINTYVDSIFYFLKDCNLDRLEYLYLDTLMDLLPYVEPTLNAVFIDKYKYNRDNLYIENAYKYIKMHDVLNMKLIRENDKAYKVAEGIIMLIENYYQ